MLRKLSVLAGPDEGRMFPLGDEPLLCGRSRANDIHLIDPHISRVHCQFLVEGGQYVINDFDSAGGTFANGKQIQRHLLQSGDLLRIGNTHLQFIVESIASPAAIKTSPGTTQISDWSKLLGFQFRQDEAVDRRLHPAAVLHARQRRHLRLLKRPERASFLPVEGVSQRRLFAIARVGGTGVDPTLEIGDHVIGQFLFF